MWMKPDIGDEEVGKHAAAVVLLGIEVHIGGEQVCGICSVLLRQHG